MLYLHIQKQLAHFQLDIHTTIYNEITIIVGSSGAGKTTLLNCIAGFVIPDSGQITFHQHDLFNKERSIMKKGQRHIGYLFQDYKLFPHMTVEKNIYYGVDKNDLHEEVERLIASLHIHHLFWKYPHEISGGEQQRVALARALSMRPKILLLDEPLASLDEMTKKVCQEILLDIHQQWKIPLIIVTHDEREALQLGNRLLCLQAGKIVTDVPIQQGAIIR